MRIMRPYKTGPRWDHVVTAGKPFHGQVALGNMTQWQIGAFWHEGRLFVGVRGRGAGAYETCVFGWDLDADFPLVLQSDSGNLADWINAQVAGEKKLPPEYIREEQGRYQSVFLTERKEEE